MQLVGWRQCKNTNCENRFGWLCACYIWTDKEDTEKFLMLHIGVCFMELFRVLKQGTERK